MMENYDVVIIGGGAAGMMAAISCKRTHPKKSVLLMDRTFALGRKILVCGAGRCNITNINLGKDLAQRYYGADLSFIKDVFEQFSYEDIVSFFADLGVELYVERKTQVGKLFPVTDQAKTITALLEDELLRLGVETRLNTECLDIRSQSLRKFFELSYQTFSAPNTPGPKKVLTADYVILSAGGKTYPALGSNGSGYMLAQKLGHKLVEPVPSALPLEGQNPLSQELQGLKLEAEATSIIRGEETKTRVDDVMFTKYGLSGPVILNISREISLEINRAKRTDISVRLNFLAGKNRVEAQMLLEERWSKRPTQTLERSLYGLFPNKFVVGLLKVAHIDGQIAAKAITHTIKEKLLDYLTNYQVRITNTRGWNEAEFTAGGVDSVQVDSQTMQSKLVPKLYLCGEILDVDGDVGGFNLSWSWASGNVAGKLKP